MPPQEQGSHCEIPNSKPVSESGGGDERIWGQRRTNLGTETNESGGRDKRIWEQRRTNLGRRTLVSRPTFAERNRD